MYAIKKKEKPVPQNLLQLDVLFITETWLNANDLTPLGELCPPHCGFLNAHRASGRGGGLATIFNNKTLLNVVFCPQLPTPHLKCNYYCLIFTCLYYVLW